MIVYTRMLRRSDEFRIVGGGREMKLTHNDEFRLAPAGGDRQIGCISRGISTCLSSEAIIWWW
ncbi:hypothetical protein A7R75_25890 [Mycolicibacterium llatzerense]|nr:hypothetical protein [Mycolicibacterium llatzerense]